MSINQSFTVSDLVKVTDVFKSFTVGKQQVEVLKDINFIVKKSDFLIIIGPSGCGKSTLLHTILGLEEPTQGKVYLLNKSIYDQSTEDDRSEFRKLHIGMVYQQPNWIKSLNVIDNLSFPLTLLGIDKPTRHAKALEFLKMVNMQNWAYYHPTELSSGQQQKVALARALINNPELIIADEPTGNLDYESGKELMLLLSKLNREQSKTIIMVTHDLEYVKYAKSSINILDGRIVSNTDVNRQKLHLSKRQQST